VCVCVYVCVCVCVCVCLCLCVCVASVFLCAVSVECERASRRTCERADVCMRACFASDRIMPTCFSLNTVTPHTYTPHPTPSLVYDAPLSLLPGGGGGGGRTWGLGGIFSLRCGKVCQTLRQCGNREPCTCSQPRPLLTNGIYRLRRCPVGYSKTSLSFLSRSLALSLVALSLARSLSTPNRLFRHGELCHPIVVRVARAVFGVIFSYELHTGRVTHRAH